MRHPHGGSQPVRSIRFAALCLAVVAFAALLPSRVPAAELFTAPFLEYPMAEQPNAVATGDFNEDGRPDAVFTSLLAPAFSVVLQNLDGTFGSAAVHGVASFVRRVVSADFDGDGHLDLAMTNDADSVLVMLGDGTGDFTSSYELACGSNPLELAVADFDGVAPADLVVANYFAGTVSAFVGVGSGVLTPYAVVSVGGYPDAVAAGDLNGDGLDDIATTHDYAYAVDIQISNGLGGFVPAPAITTDEPYGVGVRIVDIDGDGNRDVIAANYNAGGFTLWHGWGTGAFAPHVNFAGLAGAGDFQVDGVDLDLDGDRDIVLGGRSIRTLLNDGAGSFVSSTPQPPVNCVYYPFDARDMNGDGWVDVVASGNTGAGLAFFRGNGDGTLGDNRQFASVQSVDMIAADFDGDHRPDLALSSYTYPALFVQPNTGSGFGAFTPYDLSSHSAGLASGHLDGNSGSDLVAALPDAGTVAVLMNDGSGAFGTAVEYATGQRPNAVAVADLDGDGHNDIVAACLGGGETVARDGVRPSEVQAVNGVAVLLNTGSGSSFAPAVFYTSSGSCAWTIRVADVTGDGKLDLVTPLRCSSALEIYPGLGDGTFDTPTTMAAPGAPIDVQVADLDRDGHLDVVVLGESGSVSVFRGLGSGAYDARVDYPVGSYGQRLAVADLDNDGVLDVACVTQGNIVCFLPGGPAATLGTRRDYGACTSPTSLVTADVDRDGHQDLLCGSLYDEVVQYLHSTSTGTAGVAAAPAGDGRLLLVRHPAPNPATVSLALEFRLESEARVSVDVLDVSGRLVRSLLPAATRAAGTHRVTWDLRLGDGGRAPSGVYFARVRAGGTTATRRVLVTH